MRTSGSVALRASVFALLFAPVIVAQTHGSHLAAIKARGNIVMVCFPHQDNPFISVNVDKGPMRMIGSAANFKGYDVDLVAAFAKHLGVNLVIRPVTVPSYSELVFAFLRGDGDLIASSFTITPERQRVLDFSVPYVEIFNVVYVRAGSAIAKTSDLPGKRAAVVEGSSQVERLRHLGVTDFKYVEFTRDCYLAVLDKEADFAVLDNDDRGLTAPLDSKFPTLVKAFRLEGSQFYGIAVPKGSDLLPVLNSFLESAKASGELDRIFKPNRKS